MKRLISLSLLLFSAVSSFAEYVDDSYFSSKDQKRSSAKQVQREKQTTKNVKEITAVNGDTIFYKDITYDAKGSIINHIEGFYIDANEAAELSSPNQDDMKDDSSLEYSRRIKRFHNQAVVIDDDNDSWSAFNAGVAVGAATWSVFRPYGLYWTYDPWYYDPWYDWTWSYRPYYYSWGWHYPYYHHRYYYGFGYHHYPYYHYGHRRGFGPRHGIHHPYSSYSDNSRRAFRHSYNGTRGNPGSSYRSSSSSGNSYRSSGSTRTDGSYRSSGSSSYRSSGSTRTDGSYRSSGSSSYRSSGGSRSNGSYRSSGSSSYRSSGGSRSNGSYRSSGSSSYRSSGGGVSRGGSRGGGRR